MSRSHFGAYAAATLAFVVWAGCASTYNRPLVTRGISAEEREYYVVQNGFGLKHDIKRAFLDGNPIPGMNKDMVFQIYGAPDRTANSDSTWEYVNVKGTLITGLRFVGDSLADVYGDRYGGANPR